MGARVAGLFAGSAGLAAGAVLGATLLVNANEGDVRVAPVVVPGVVVDDVVVDDVDGLGSSPAPASTTALPAAPAVTAAVVDVPVVPVMPAPAVVPGLAERSGVLERRDDEYVLGGLELDIAPPWWLRETVPGVDLDGDGVPSAWSIELGGLVGTTITVLGEVEDDEIDVYQIDGVEIRPLIDGSEPWDRQG